MSDHNSNELQHYGVVGMRWGVRRGSRQLSKATTKEKRDKAIASLNKHKTKGEAEIKKLQSKTSKLETKANKASIKYDEKAAKIKARAARKRKAAYRWYRTADGGGRKAYKAAKLDAKADKMIAKSEKAKAALERNKKMQEAFAMEVSKIDKALVDSGKRYVKYQNLSQQKAEHWKKVEEYKIKAEIDPNISDADFYKYMKKADDHRNKAGDIDKELKNFKW